MIELIKHENMILAIIIRKDFSKEGIEFFTPKEFSQQLAYMKRQKGYSITPHVHNAVPRTVEYTQEVLFIKSGKVRVDFYLDPDTFFKSCELSTGDVILLARGGHGFIMLEESEIVEVKQGPYAEEQDKTRFEGLRK